MTVPAAAIHPHAADNYYLLPFCKPRPGDKPRHKWGGLGEVLQGNELIDSQLELKFRTDLPKRDICSMTLGDEAVGGPGAAPTLGLLGAALCCAVSSRASVC